MTGQSLAKSDKKTIPAVMDSKLLLNALSHVFKGGLRFRKGHIPPHSHKVAVDFSGVGVAASADPAVDDYLLEKLKELGVRNVRIDFSYGDENSDTARLLEKLLATDLKVLLHLVQPFDEARSMRQESAQQKWREFVENICDLYGHRVHTIEVGSTINRRRWAGYDTKGFFTTWKIAYEEIKGNNIKMAGPNISDFEPFYTFAVLERLRKSGMLPDFHTNNLFCERVTEPERFDHRILGFQWATRLKVNLVKKARLLHRIGARKGVDAMVSPAAFWTLPRIQRLLENSEEKMADYLSRYMVLLAASGAMRRTFWGPMVCWREGLIDDGSGRYPQLERITHYQSIIGKLPDFRVRPAFYAMKQFNAMLPGSVYEGTLKTAENLEVHVFRAEHKRIHVAWTINGKACELEALYQASDLAKAEFQNRDGEAFDEAPRFISESPLYMSWPLADKIDIKPLRAPYPLESIYAHRSNGRYYPYHQNGWRGMLIADNAAEAEKLAELLHPDNVPAATAETTLRKARNIIWTVPGPDGHTVVAKKPLKMHAHKRILDRFKPSKAHRSWIAAAELSRRGIPTAQPLAYFEKDNDKSMLQNLFVCEKVDHDFSAREMLIAFRDGANQFEGIEAHDAYRQLATFLLRMHEHGVFFRDLAGGNILIKKQPDHTLAFTLIDINRARFYNRSTPLKQRISDLTRICHKLHWAGREYLVEHYLHSMLKPQTFSWRLRLPFYLYDFKVNFKRRYGRKAIKRLWRKLSKKD